MISLPNNSLVEAAKITDSIPGFLLRTEGRLLYNIAKACPANTKIVEIGSWQGRSTLWLALGSLSGNKAKILAVDPHTGSPELLKILGKQSSLKLFLANIKKYGVDRMVRPMVMTSEAAAHQIKSPIGMVFIDGDHSYQSVKRDFELWFPKIITNGALLLHDTVGYPEINRLVKKMIFLSPNIQVIKIVDSIIYGQKREHLSQADIIKNRYILLLHDISVFFSKHKPPNSLIVLGKYILAKIH